MIYLEYFVKIIIGFFGVLFFIYALWCCFSKTAKQIYAEERKRKEYFQAKIRAKIEEDRRIYNERMENDPEFRQEQQEYERINRQEEKMKRDNDFNFMRDFCGQDPD